MNPNATPPKDQAATLFITQMEGAAATVKKSHDTVKAIIDLYRVQKMVALCAVISELGAKAEFITGMDMQVGDDGAEILHVIVPKMDAESLATLGLIEKGWRLVGGDFSAILCKGDVTVTEAQLREVLGGGPA